MTKLDTSHTPRPHTPFPALQSSIDDSSSTFKENYAAMTGLLDHVRSLEGKIVANSERSRAKFEQRGQILPRERLEHLIDRGSPFLEISSLCGYKVHDDDGDKSIMGGAVIAGIGVINDVRCAITINDSGIKGGYTTALGNAKAQRMQQIALENKIPLVSLIESGGANLLRQSELFVDSGRFFANMARLSAAGVPTITVVHGSSTAGGAYVPGMSDYVVMVKDRAKVYLAGPPLLLAATGEVASEQELGGAEMHAQIAGTAEYVAENDSDAIRLARAIVPNARRPQRRQNRGEVEAPLFPADQLLGIVPVDYRRPYDVRDVIARVTDGSRFQEMSSDFGSMTVVGHARIWGHEVGIIGNNGPIEPEGAAKAAHFIQLCCQSDTPLLFLHNTTGFIVGKRAEQAGAVKHGAKLIQAVANAHVPRITIHIGASFGAGNYGMSGRGLDPRFIFAWPNNRVAVMGGEQAARVLSIVSEESAARTGREPDRAALEKMQQTIIKTYDEESTALFATARLWDDGIIDPRDTRDVVGLCLDLVEEERQSETQVTNFGVARF
ncbi:acyl-CoA carboxylase subunit beta [Erythrobacter sp. AP23]|uniref:acyl-CoA carboxylase subunit beta n=1 Tax=Erythrobacter sp. AP23 TaxID=499656 RepID=UPI00076D5E77|nr:carboxyl transferase domain-containing protein [Erythrobacter sp. AP23]KWV93788.1 acetyl-CoA carboxylase carboxyltransferase subunit [Erythrobacter sp. AP23]